MTFNLRKMAVAVAILFFAGSAAAETASGGLGKAGLQDATIQVMVRGGGTGPVSKHVVLPVRKSAIVELPRDARDILVSDPEIVEAVVKTPRQVYIIGRGAGSTNLFFFDGSGNQILNLEVRVELETMDVVDAIKRLVPDGDIDVEALNGNIVLSGIVNSAADSNQAYQIARRFVEDDENVVNMLAIEGEEQVILRVKIAEVQRNVVKQLGVDMVGVFGDLAVFSQNAFGVTGLPTGGLSAIGDIFFDSDRSSVLTTTFQALERDGLVRILAEPNLTAVSGEAARFLAGGEFPVPTGRDRDGNVTIVFREFGVGLGFTPVVLSEGKINLRLSTEVSQLSNATSITLLSDPTNQVPAVVVPGLSVRRAETTVELPSGGSLVIAGLLQSDIQKSIEGTPGLKDIPVLGALFRSNDFQNNETELVIVVTPYLVKPVDEREIVLPTDGLVPGSDLDTVLLGRLTGAYGIDSGPRAGKLEGPYGYIME